MTWGAGNRRLRNVVWRVGAYFVFGVCRVFPSFLFRICIPTRFLPQPFWRFRSPRLGYHLFSNPEILREGETRKEEEDDVPFSALRDAHSDSASFFFSCSLGGWIREGAIRFCFSFCYIMFSQVFSGRLFFFSVDCDSFW